jgi:hypothetical protein
MGVSIHSKILFEAITNSFQDESNIDIIELGDQDMVVNGRCDSNFKFRNDMKGRFKSWTTLDLHDVDGVTICDLSLPIDKFNICDVVTNFGTSEHVEYQEGQYNCWLNIHNFLRKDGYMLHVVPPPGHWIGHGRYHYSEEFFRHFENYGYEVINCGWTEPNLIYCTLKKEKLVEFMSFEEFMSKITFNDIVHEDLFFKGNNPKGLKF